VGGAQARKGRPDADVLWNKDLIHVVGKKMGLYDKLDPARVSNLRDVYDVARDKDGIGVMQGFQAEGVPYSTRVFLAAIVAVERGIGPGRLFGADER